MRWTTLRFLGGATSTGLRAGAASSAASRSAGRCHPQLRPGMGAAFSIVNDAGAEAIALVQAVKPARDATLYPEIAQQIRALILEQHGVGLAALVLTRARDIPQTTSGKVQRQLCRSRFLCGELHPVFEVAWG